jgi:hypothetical protein
MDHLSWNRNTICLLESSNIIIKSYNVQAKKNPQFLKPYIMHYFFWKVASGHVHKLIKSEFLQNMIYVCQCHFHMSFGNMPLKQNGMKNAREQWETQHQKCVSFITRTFFSYVPI